MPLTDHRIIARQSATAGGIEVLATRHEVMWPDGTAVLLHPVRSAAGLLRRQRALHRGDGTLQLISLSTLVPVLDDLLHLCQPMSDHTLVFGQLRARYRNAESLLAAATRTALGTWWPVGGGYTWQPAPRAIDPTLAGAV